MPVKKQRKIAVMGFRAVGKSSISLQYCENHFVESYNPTIENTFHKTIRLNGEEFVTDIVDTAGQDEHSNFQPQYAIGIHGYILVYAISNRFSFNLIKTLNDKILNAVGVNRVPRVLVGNKTDLEKDREISSAEGQALANEWGCAFVECSAKQNVNVGEVFQACLREIEKAQGVNPPPAQSDCVLL